MTNWDDFDKEPTDDDDDLSWLDDDDLFEETDKGGKKGNATGFTGELPWMQGDDDDESVSDNDDDLGWLDDEEPAASADSDDGLNWGAVDTGEHEDLSWLADDEEDKPGEWQAPHPDVVNDEFERNLEAAEAADFGDTDSDLDWLTSDEPTSELASGGLDLPDWMADMELPDVSDDDLAAAHASVDDDDEDSFDFGTTDTGDSGWGLDDNEDDYATDEEPEVSFASMFGEEEDEGVSFDSILAGTSDDDDGDLGFLSSMSGTGDDDEGDLGFLGSMSGDDDDELESIPTGRTDTSQSREDDFWGEVGSTGFTQEMDAVESEPEPVNTGWGMDLDDADENEGMDFDSILAGASDTDEDDLDFLGSLSDDDNEEQAATDFDAMFALEAVSDTSADDDLDDLLAELDTGDDADVDDLLATLDVGDSEDVSMDDLLAELEGVDSGDSGDLDDLLATLDTSDESDYEDMPLAFDDSGVSEMLDSMSDDELDFLADIESETEVEEYDDAVDPLAFDSGITDMFDTLEGDELSFLTEMEEQLEDPDAEYEDEIEPLAFDSGITELMNQISTSDLDLLGQMEAELEADAEPADELDFLANLDEKPEPADELDFDFDFGEAEPEPAASADDELDFLASLEADEQPEPAASDELDFDFDFGDEEPEPAASADDELDFLASLEADETLAPADELEFLADLDEAVEPIASSDDTEFDFSFGGEVEEAPEPETPVRKKPDSGLLSRTDDLVDDFGFGDNADWLSALDEAIEDDTVDEPEPAPVNVDSLLSSIGAVDDIAEDDSDAVPIDLDELFDEYGMDEEYGDDEDFALEDVAEAAEIPEWLRAVASADSDKYEASKVIRELKDRSLDDLDERLQDLHERGLEITAEESETEADRQRLKKVVPNISEALIPAKVTAGETALVSIEPQLNPEQLKRAELLRSIVGEVVAGESEASVRVAPRRRRLRLPIGRWLIALLLAAVIIAPFYISDLHISDVLPVIFDDDSPAAGAYEVIDSIQPYEPVLFAVEYGAVGAMELDLLTETLLTHILHHGGLPVIVSSDPVGALRAEAIAARLAGAEGYNTEYYVAGYIPAGSLGLRDLTENLGTVIDSNSNGQLTNLDVNSLDDFKLIVFVTDGGETVRDWMEQVVPETNTPIIIGMGQSARPIAQPYISTYLGNKVAAVLVGYPDAVTYQNMLVADYALGAAGAEETETVEAEATDEATATPEPTDVPTNTPEPTVEATDEAVVPVLDQTEEVEDEATVEPTLEATEVEEDEPTATDEPTDTPEPTDVPATNTPAPSPTAAATEEEMVEVAVVIADGRVNVREGPGAGFNVVSTVGPGDRLRIIGRNDAEDWIQIVLPDGREAWIAAFLVNTEFIPESEAESLYDWGGKVRYYRPPVQDSIEQADTATPSPSPTAEPMVNVGSNASGTTIDVFDNADLQGTPIEDLPNGTEFVVLEQTDDVSNILMVDGRTGWVESRFVRIVEMTLSESGFAPTNTPTPTPTLTPTLTATATATLTPTATPFTPDVFPQPLTDTDARWNAMTLGLLTTILLIFAGNVYWITRWLRRRGK